MAATLESILEDIFDQVGLEPEDFDVTAGSTTMVSGFTINARMVAREAIDPLLRAFAFTLVEVDGLLTLVSLDTAVQGDIDEADLGAFQWPGIQSDKAVPKVAGRLLDDVDKPIHLDLNYVSAAHDYEQASQSAERFTKTDLQEPMTVNLPIVLTEEEGDQIAHRLLYEQWLHGEQFNFTLPPRWLSLAPADLWRIPVEGSDVTIRITRMDMALPLGPLEIEAVLYNPDVITQFNQGGDLHTDTDEQSDVEDTALLYWSDNPLRDADADEPGVYLGANGATPGDWVGATVYWSRDGGTTYDPLEELVDPATYGEADTILAAPVGIGTAFWDTVNTVDVTITTGAPPVTITDLEVLNGGNALRFETGEVIQFAVVTALGGDQYRLSRLLRGRQGTDAYWGDHAALEQVVFLSPGTIKHVPLPEDLVGKIIFLKGVTDGQSLAAVTAVSLTITGNELKPWSGADGQGERHVPATNDWTVEWKRRTRKGGTWADFADAQLHDTPEAYEAEVWDATYTTLKRTFTPLSTPTFVYTAAQQTTDFGAVQSTIYLRVFQIGRYGRGYSLDFSLTEP